MLFDSASVIDRISIDAEVEERLSKVSGSLFEDLPRGGDAYILRRVLHDWCDEKAIDILRQCRNAIPQHGTLLIIELAAAAAEASGNQWATSDLLMMLLFNGRERTVAEFSRILGTAGFALTRVIQEPSPFWIIEAVPA